MASPGKVVVCPENCPICIEPMTTRVSALACGHLFHRDCLKGVYNGAAPRCPSCRAPIDRRQEVRLVLDLQRVGEAEARVSAAAALREASKLPPPPALAALRGELEAARGVAAQSAASADYYRSEASGLRARVEDLTERLGRAQGALEEVQGKYSVIKHSYGDLRERYKAVAQEHAELQRARLVVDFAAKGGELERLRRDVKGRLAGYEGSAEALEMALTKRNETLEGEKLDLRSERDTLREERDEKAAALLEEQRKNSRLLRQAAAVVEEKKRLEAVKDRVRGERDALRAQLTAARQKLGQSPLPFGGGGAGAASLPRAR